MAAAAAAAAEFVAPEPRFPQAGRAFESVLPGAWDDLPPQPETDPPITMAIAKYLLARANFARGQLCDSPAAARGFAWDVSAQLRNVAARAPADAPPDTQAYARVLVAGLDGPVCRSRMNRQQRALLEFVAVVGGYVPEQFRDDFLHEYVVVRHWRAEPLVLAISVAAGNLSAARVEERRGCATPWTAIRAAASSALLDSWGLP
jgi:hypothetical protein